MAWFNWFSNKHEIEKDFEKRENELKLEYFERKQQQKLDFEKEKQELDMKRRRKEAELDNIILDYKIADEKLKIQEDFGEDEEETQTENSDDTFKILLSKILQSKTEQKTTHPDLIAPVSSEVPMTRMVPEQLNLTDAEIEALYQATDANTLKIAKKSPDNLVKQFIKQKYPSIAEECLNRVVLRIKR